MKTKYVEIEVTKTVTQTLSDTLIVVVPADYTDEQIKEGIDQLADSDFDLDGFLTNEVSETDILTAIVGRTTKAKAEATVCINLGS